MKKYVIEQDVSFMQENGFEFFIMKFPTIKRTVPPHIHNSIEILFFTKGTFKVTVENMDFEASEGEMCLFRSQTIHSVFPTKVDTNYYVLKIKPALLLSLSSPKNGSLYSLLLSLALSNDSSKIRWSAEECKHRGFPEIFDRIAKEMKSPKYGADIFYKICIGEILLKLLLINMLLMKKTIQLL